MNSLPLFLCDGMLGQLCRYLRAAGYDTLFDNKGLPDRDLLRQCKEQGRFFLTCDQLIREHKAAHGVCTHPAAWRSGSFGVTCRVTLFS